MTIDLVASGMCSLTVVHNNATAVEKLYTAPVTLVIGDEWMTLRVGERRLIRVSGRDVRPRVATEADVLNSDNTMSKETR